MARDRQQAAVWATLAFLGLCVAVGFGLIWHLFGVEHQNRDAQATQTAQELASQHQSVCAVIAMIPLPADATGFLHELERRSGCPMTVPRPLPTATSTVTVLVPSKAPVGVAGPTAVVPTAHSAAPTGTPPTRTVTRPTPSPAPTPSPTPSPACVLGLLCLGRNAP